MNTNKFVAFMLTMIVVLVTVKTPISSNQQFSLKSSAFLHNTAIPTKYTCIGANKSTPLEWTGTPVNTKSFALIMDDPDAQRVVGYTWVHWIVYNIPTHCQKLPEGIATQELVSLGNGITITQGVTSWNKPGYGGPCPPRGTGIHHYHFRLYALSIEPTLPSGLTKNKLIELIKKHIIAEALLVGTYEKK